MPHCESFEKLEIDEKTQLIGETVHALQNDEIFHLTVTIMLNNARQRGVFDKVKFGIEALKAQDDKAF